MSTLSQNFPHRGRVLEKASSIINGERLAAYGEPEDNFATIAKFWSHYKGIDFSAHDVALMMVLLKVARIKSGSGKEDSYVDLCGYAALAADMAERDGPDKGLVEEGARYAAKK